MAELIEPTKETIISQIQPKDSAEHIITEENLRFAEDIKISLLKKFLRNHDFENLIDNLIEYYNSLGPDLFEHRGKTLQELILIRTAQVLAEKGNKKMKFYLNDIRKKVVEVYESGFGESDIISRLKERGFDEIGLEICRSLFRLHANKIGPDLERIEVMTKALAFTEEDPTSRLWFVSMMIEIDPKFNAFYEKISNSRLSGNEHYSPEKIRRIICHPLCYNTLKARFKEFKKFLEEKLAQLDLEKINKIIERVYTFADTEINYAGELGQQIALQSTKQINKKDGKLSLSYVAARVHNNGTLDDGERESEQGKSGTDHAPNADEMNSVFDQIIANSGYNYTNQPKNSPNTPKDLDDVVPPPENNEDEETWQDYLARLQSLADNFEEKKVSIETGLRKETILGRIEHEKAVHRVFRAIEIIVREMKIENAIVTKKATITNPTYIEKDPNDNSEKANKKHNYRTDLVLILPGGSAIILEAKNTTELFGQANQQVGIYAGAAQVAGEIWVEQRQMNVTNIHTAMIFAKGPEKVETTAHSQNFIDAQQKALPNQIILLDDPNWIWNLLSLIRNKGLLNQENISTTRSSGFSYLKKTKPQEAFPQLPNSQEIAQKVLESDSKYNPQSPLNSADKHLETALNTKDATPTELESRYSIKKTTLKDMFVTSLSLGSGYSIQQLERDGATKEVIVEVGPLFMYDQKLNDFMLLRRQVSLLNNLHIGKNQPLFQQKPQDQSNILKLLIVLEESEGLNFADPEFSATAEEIEDTRKTFLTGDAIPSTDNILSLLSLYKNYKIQLKKNQNAFSPMISLPEININLNDLGAALHIMISIRIAKILEQYEAKDAILKTKKRVKPKRR